MKKLDIKRALLEHHMTQVELAQKSGIIAQNISAIIKGGNPTISKLIQIAEGIGCDITDLFYSDSETEDTGKELPVNENNTESIKEVEPENPIIQTETFCPHCGKRVKVGVVLMAE